MDALILSCGTGGGHNAAGQAVCEELERRGHKVEMFDPYMLLGRGVPRVINNIYIKIAQRCPSLFGLIYQLGQAYRYLPVKSPVYKLQRKPAAALSKYLKKHPADVVVMPHLFPAEIMTSLKKSRACVTKMVFIATDYTCIPFTEETECDAYIIPSKELTGDFTRWGIPKEKLYPFGIPVSSAFTEPVTKQEAKKRLGLEQDRQYYLLAGGSIGGGQLQKYADQVYAYVKICPKTHMIIICGNNMLTYHKLCRRYGSRATVLQHTDEMPLYMRASEIYFTKPGGLSSTEAAAAAVPMIHISPIPGCEDRNRDFFTANGMSVAVYPKKKSVFAAIRKLQQEENRRRMAANQHRHVNAWAREEICDLLEKMTDKEAREDIVEKLEQAGTV